MTKVELLKRLERIEQELADVRACLLQGEPKDTAESGADMKNEDIAYTLEDLYHAFGKKKQSYATRLKTTLTENGIGTLKKFLRLTPGQLFELEGIGSGTLLQTKKALDRLGVTW